LVRHDDGAVAAEVGAVQGDAVPGDRAEAAVGRGRRGAVVDAADGRLEGVQGGEGAPGGVGAADAVGLLVGDVYRGAREQRGVGDVPGAARQRVVVVVQGVVEGDADGEGPLLAVGVRAADEEGRAGAARLGDRAGGGVGGAAVAPVDGGGGEVGGGDVVGVGELEDGGGAARP